MKNLEATEAQIRYAKKLLEDLGYDSNDYDFDVMNRSDISELIDELKNELGVKENGQCKAERNYRFSWEMAKW